MANIHPAAALGYAAHSETYVSGRPGYPVDVDLWLAGDLGLRAGQEALDLGAGTGKFTGRLVATGASVSAVEPVTAMLERFRQQHAGVDVRTGSAEAIPFGNAVFDAVVCAQSFHWFATKAALAEICRVLKPGGRLGLIWNVRDESKPWVAALAELVEPFSGDAPRFSSQQWRTVFPAEGFRPLREQKFRFEHRGSPEQVIVDRTLSISFVAALAPAEQNEVVRQVRDLIAATPDLQGKSEVSFPYQTVACSCTRL